MKKRLTLKETIFVASALFGMFFGAGNLIFPVHLGQLAGSNSIVAIVGFCITAVTIPILGVVVIGSTNSSNVYELSSKVSKKFGLIFTCLLYLTIGPFFAAPRCASTFFSAGVVPMLHTDDLFVYQLLFTFIFFVIVLVIALRQNEILTWIGKVINPLFLAFYLFLVIIALINPGGAISAAKPVESYQSASFFNSFVEGYNTMDGIAGLCFGIVIVDIIKDLGIKEDRNVARSVIRSGIFTAFLLIVIYSLSVIMGAESRGLFPVSENGGIALSQIASHYLGMPGNIILAIILLLACLKTAISIVSSFGKMFYYLFPKGLKYKTIIYIVCVFAFIVSNVGLTSIINGARPILMLLYPLSTVLIFLGIFENAFEKSTIVYKSVIIFTFIPAFCDFLKALPFNIDMTIVSETLPFFDLGFGWVAPAVIGLLVGLGLKASINAGEEKE